MHSIAVLAAANAAVMQLMSSGQPGDCATACRLAGRGMPACSCRNSHLANRSSSAELLPAMLAFSAATRRIRWKMALLGCAYGVHVQTGCGIAAALTGQLLSAPAAACLSGCCWA